MTRRKSSDGQTTLIDPESVIDSKDSPTLAPVPLQVNRTVAPAVLEGAGNLPVRGSGDESDLVRMLERLALSPDVPVDKLVTIVNLQERIIERNAKAAFDDAYAQMQPELPEIDEKGQIVGKDKQVRSRYAKYEDIQRETRPVLSKWHFALRHRTEWPLDKPGIIRIVGILSGYGHSEESAFEAPMDKSEYRTDVQSQGSTVSYGRRYTTIDLLNIITKGVDNDGATAGRPEPPEGYHDALLNLEAAVPKGLKALEQEWTATAINIRNYMGKHDAQAYAALRKRAQETGR